MKNSTELKKTLELMQKFNVTYYESGPLKIRMSKPEAKIETVKIKDLSLPAKSKEQEAEEILFHSAMR